MSDEAVVQIAPAPVVADVAPAAVDTVVSDVAVPDAAPEVVDYFSSTPEDWRSQMLSKAGFEEGADFDKAMKQMERVPDMGALGKNYLEAQAKIRSGEMSTGLPENPTDEQLADWREARGLPQSPEGYELSLNEGLELSEDEAEIMKVVYQIAHTENVSQGAINGIINTLKQHEKQQQDAFVSQSGVDKLTADKQLKEVWGGDYTTNINMVSGLVNQLPETIKESFMQSQMADGKLMFNSPEVMVAMAEWARKINPAATVVPNSANPMQSMNDEINDLESQMGTDEWYKDIDKQQRYMKLKDAQKQMKG